MAWIQDLRATMHEKYPLTLLLSNGAAVEFLLADEKAPLVSTMMMFFDIPEARWLVDCLKMTYSVCRRTSIAVISFRFKPDGRPFRSFKYPLTTGPRVQHYIIT